MLLPGPPPEAGQPIVDEARNSQLRIGRLLPASR